MSVWMMRSAVRGEALDRRRRCWCRKWRFCRHPKCAWLSSTCASIRPVLALCVSLLETLPAPSTMYRVALIQSLVAEKEAWADATYPLEDRFGRHIDAGTPHEGRKLASAVVHSISIGTGLCGCPTRDADQKRMFQHHRLVLLFRAGAGCGYSWALCSHLFRVLQRLVCQRGSQRFQCIML